MKQQPLNGLTVLVLEDEYLIAMEIEDVCRESGATEVRLAASIDEATALSGAAPVDVAVIDLNLRGQSTLDFARTLQERGVPFLFATGMTDLSVIGPEFATITVIDKPYDTDTLVGAITATVRGGAVQTCQ